MKKAVFFDIDGTLIHSMGGIIQMTPRVKKALHQLKEQGHEIWVSTGRPYAFLPKAILEFDFDGMILCNGAHIIHKNETIYKDPMDQEFVRQLVDLFEENEIQYILEGSHYSYMKKEFKECGDLYEGYGVNRQMLLPEYDLEQINVYKVELLCPNKEIFERGIQFLDGHPEYDYYHSVTHFLLELYPKKNTKATAIERVLRILDLPVEQSYAFGDGKNDIEMLQTVGMGIAMDNAADEVKQHADQVTSSVEEDGVAEGIYQYILD